MFSDLGEKGFSYARARSRESLLDVLLHAGLSVLWLDNNTGSKGVARASQELALAGAADPRRCNAAGCFDDILVDALEQRLAAVSFGARIAGRAHGRVSE